MRERERESQSLVRPSFNILNYQFIEVNCIPT